MSRAADSTTAMSVVDGTLEMPTTRGRTMTTDQIVMITVYAADFTASPQPQPFPLQGSKRRQVPVINRLIPAGRPRLVEPFCGSAAVSIGARYYGLVGDVLISDSNASLITLWQDILKQPDRLAGDYETVWSAQFDTDTPDPRAYFNMVRDRYNEATVGETADFLFLLNRIVKAALRYSKNGKMNQSADGRRTGAKPSTVKQRLVNSSQVLSGAHAQCDDWMDVLSSVTPEDIVYLDPPYQGTTDTRDQRYVSGMDVRVFEDGVRHAVTQGLSAIISYDALRGPALYGRPLDPAIGLVALDVITGLSAQGTLLGRRQEAHETIYLTPALVERLGGVGRVADRVAAGVRGQTELLLTM